MPKRRSVPAWGNASAEPTRPLVLPLNRAARKRYAKLRGVTLAEVPALNRPIVKPKDLDLRTKKLVDDFLKEHKDLMEDLAKAGD